MLLTGAGFGLIFSPLNTDALNRLPDSMRGQGSGVIQTFRNFGSALGMAIMGSIVAGATDLTGADGPGNFAAAMETAWYVGAGDARRRLHPRPALDARAASRRASSRAMADFAARRSRMVERQLRRAGSRTSGSSTRWERAPREAFVPASLRRRAYADGALPIGEGQTISQPWVVAAICQALALQGSERVLEVGTGSGYSAACSRCSPPR